MLDTARRSMLPVEFSVMAQRCHAVQIAMRSGEMLEGRCPEFVTQTSDDCRCDYMAVDGALTLDEHCQPVANSARAIESSSS
jgi:hypothetical protein